MAVDANLTLLQEWQQVLAELQVRHVAMTQCSRLALPVRVGNFPILSLVGFLLMFAAGVLAMRSGPSTGGKSTGAGTGPRASGGGKKSPKAADGSSYSSRMEDRFRRRFEQ